MQHRPAVLAVSPPLPSGCSAEDSNTVYDHLETIQHNFTALHQIRAPPWVSAPNMRRTSSILYSCILTLFACVYTALHLNIPEPGAGYFRLLRTKCIWVSVALVAPKLLYYACSQFLEARSLAKYLREKDAGQSGRAAGAKSARGIFRGMLKLGPRRVRGTGPPEDVEGVEQGNAKHAEVGNQCCTFGVIRSRI